MKYHHPYYYTLPRTPYMHVRSWVMDMIFTLATAASDRLVGPAFRYDPDPPITCRLKIGWWIEDRLMRVWTHLYTGSCEELESILNDEIPAQYLSPDQIRFQRYVWQGSDPNTPWPIALRTPEFSNPKSAIQNPK